MSSDLSKLLSKHVKVTQDPVDWTMIRIPIEGYEVGTKHKVVDVKDDLIYLEGCIHAFHKNDVSV